MFTKTRKGLIAKRALTVIVTVGTLHHLQCGPLMGLSKVIRVYYQ